MCASEETDNQIREITKKVLDKNIPTGEEIKIAESFMEKLKQSIKHNQTDAECFLGGSVAKRTNLKGDFDADIFIRFSKEHVNSSKISDLSEELEKILITAGFTPERIHGSRDYFQIIFEEVTYEVVPVLKISDPAEANNVTDLSPLHVAWVKKQNKGNEIRLSKLFCKSIGVYGAESYIQGFSGHVLDILTIHYGSFLGLIKKASRWKDKEIIDPEDHHKGNDPLTVLNASKTISPLVLVDPIDKTRNAGAALSKKNFDKFREKAKEFLNSPSEAYFRKKEFDIDKQRDSAKGTFIGLKALPLEKKKDVAGAKIMKLHDLFKRKLKQNDFDVLASGFHFSPENSFIYFDVSPETLDKKKKIEGPFKNREEHCKRFMEKHPDFFEEDGKLCAIVDREFTDPGQLINWLIKEASGQGSGDDAENITFKDKARSVERIY